MNGTDHQEPQPWLGRVVAEANALQDDYVLEVTALADYLAGAPTDGLPRWKGELRSGARANVLMGVASNRVDVKRQAAGAERALERRAEPYCALYLPAERWPQALLDVAWKQIVRNAAHDSVCACSVDEVVDAVLTRYAEARRIGEGLADQALPALARSLADAGPTVVNPSARPAAAWSRWSWPATRFRPTPRPCPKSPAPSGSPGGSVRSPSTPTRSGPSSGCSRRGARSTPTRGSRACRSRRTRPGSTSRSPSAARNASTSPWPRSSRTSTPDWGPDPTRAVRIRIDQPPIRRVLARVTDVPGFGWRSCTPAPLAHPVTVTDGEGGGTAGGRVGRARQRSGDGDRRPASGTFALDGVAGFGRLVDGGDHGDSYNYSPPLRDRLVDTPDSVSVVVSDRGPVRACAVITAGYRGRSTSTASPGPGPGSGPSRSRPPSSCGPTNGSSGWSPGS